MTALRNCESYHATYPPLRGDSVDPEDDEVGKWETLERTERTAMREFRKFS